MLGRIVLILARYAAMAIRPLERMALFSLRAFLTPRGPLLFFAAVTLLIATLIALILYAPGPGQAAWTKILLGLFAFALFCGYLRAYFAVRSETEAALAGLLREDDSETVAVSPDVPDRMAPEPRYPGVLTLPDLALFLIGLLAAHTTVTVGLLEGGFGPVAYDDAGAEIDPTAVDWMVYALWATLGVFDPIGLAPRFGDPLRDVTFDWGWVALWIVIYRLVLLGVVFSLAASAFDVRRKVAMALSRPGDWWQKTQHLQRLGHAGFRALVDSLGDPERERREDAAHMLGVIGAFPEEAAQALVRALGDKEDGVRARAAESLGALGSAASEAAEPLVERLDDDAPSVRREAAAALGAVAAGRPELAYPAMAALAKACPEEPEGLAAADWATLAAIAKSLAELAASVDGAEEEAVRAVDRLRGHPEAYVRQTAVEAYGQLKASALAQVHAKMQRDAQERAMREAEEWARRDWRAEQDWRR